MTPSKHINPTAMHASITYLLILLGIGLGVALGGIMGGLIGGVGFFLLHRTYTLSKRLAAIDERLRHLDTLTEAEPTAPSQPPSPDNPAQMRADLPVAHVATQPPASAEPDPIVALNSTLQALLPALNALKATAPATLPEPIQPTPTEPLRESVAVHFEKNDLTEATAAAIAIEHVLLNALRNSALDAASVREAPDKPAPVVHRATIEAPAPIAHENTTHGSTPTLDGGRSNAAVPPSISSDLEHLRDELTTLMSDISSERARHAKTAAKAPAEAEPADAKTLQELLIELRRLTANTPSPQH